MRTNFRRAMAGAAAFAVAAVLSPLATGTAFAGTPSLAPGAAAAGTASPNPATGNSDTTWSILENTGATQFTCPQDSASEGGNFSTFMVPSTVDVSQLGFNSGTPVAGPAGTYQANLYSASGSQVKNVSVQAAPGRQAITTTFKFSANGAIPPGTIPAGAYKIGVACFSTADTNPRYPTKFYSRTVTLTTDSVNGGSSQFTYQTGAAAAQPTAVTAAAGNQQCTVSFTPGASDPAVGANGYTAIAHPGSGPDITQTGNGSPITIPGLTNNTAYTVSVTATNSIGTSAPAAASNNPCTPVSGPRNNVQNLAAGAPAPGATDVVLTWNAPAANNPPALPTSYDVNWTGPQTGTANVPYGTGGPYTKDVTGLTTTGIYTFTVVTNYADNPTTGAPPAPSVQASISPSSLVNQQIDVTRPVGALVLTQVCGSNSAVNGVPAGKPGFPSGTPNTAANNPSTVGSPAAINAGDTPGTGYTPKASKDVKGTVTGADPNAAGYPYPTNPDGTVKTNLVYPSWCGLHLNNAQFVTRGPGAGQYFSTSGVMNEVTVVDTRDGDTTGWSATGIAGTFSDGAGDTFVSKTLGWAPRVSDFTGPFDNGNGTVYTPDPVAGAGVDPGHGAAPTNGLSVTRPLAGAVHGLGITILDARIDLLIPVTANAGLYESTMTISVA